MIYMILILILNLFVDILYLLIVLKLDDVNCV